MIEYSKVRKKFGWNDILPYIEISKPKLRNNLNQLFAMKNSILILCLLFAGVTLSQDPFVLEQPFYSKSKVDSILVFQVGTDSPVTNKAFFRNDIRDSFVRTCRTKRSRDFNLVGSYSGRSAIHTFNEFGVYAVVCFEDGKRSGVTFFCVDKKFLRIKRNTNLSAPEQVGEVEDRYVMG
jgi:hypothetical protein